jgi:hypothetical protein
LKRFRIFFIILILTSVITLIHLANVSAEESSLPNWLKDMARQWADGQMSDDDFIGTLQWLVDQKILIIPQPADSNQQNTLQGFSGMVCTQGYKYVQMTGRYTNGDIPYSVIFLRLSLTNNVGDVVATGSGIISHINAHQTKFFDAIAIYSGNFTTCDIQIDSAIPEKKPNG